MIEDKEKIIKLAKDFINICKDNNIWYSVDNGTLLGAVREKGMIDWDDDFDVMMTVESFEKLKKLFPQNIIDNDHDKYPLMIPKFMNNKDAFLESAVFIDIFLIIPSTIENIKKFRSFKNKSRFAIQCVHSDWKCFNLGSKILKIFSWPFKKMFKKITTSEGIKILESNTPTYFYSIDNPIDPEKINKQPKLSLKTLQMKFENFNVEVAKEYHEILLNKYGKDYLIPNKAARSIEHINAISIKKVKR